MRHLKTFRGSLFMWILYTALLPGLDVSGAESPSWQHTYHFPAGSMGPLAIRDGYVYVQNAWTRGDGILVFDVRKPSAPAFMGGIAGRGYLKHCAISGNTLYVDAGFSLMVVDISKPETCRLVRNMSFGFPAMDVGCLTVSGDRLYVGGQTGGLRLLDISEPNSPVIVAHYPEYGRISSLSASDDLLIVQPNGRDAVVMTASGEALTERARLKSRGRLQLVGRSLYETDVRQTTIYDLSDPAAPAVKTNLPRGAPVGMLTPTQMLVALPDHRFRVLDVSDPLNPVTRREFEMPADVQMGSLALSDQLLYLADRTRSSLRIFDISGGKAKELGERSVMRNEGTVEIGEHHAFFCYGEGMDTTVLSVDLQKTGAMDFVARITTVAKTNAFAVADVFRAGAIKRIGKFLLTGDGLVDVGDPLQMKVLRPMIRSAAAITVENGRAYLAQGDRLTILDVKALPDMPVAGTYCPEDKGRHITDVALGKDTAYLVNNDKAQPQIEILDVSDPSQPRLLGQCAVPPSIVCALNGNYLYVPGIGFGKASPCMVIVDVSNPRAPVIVKSITGLVNVSCYRIRVHGTRLYFTDSMRGIQEADISDPLNPRLVETYTGPADVSCSYTDFHVSGDKLYGQRYSGLDVWKLTDSESKDRGKP
ncbi:MAG: hypothetical protein WCS96_08260 [Victivallales bacterium]